MVESLGREAKHLGVTRKSVIKMWIAEAARRDAELDTRTASSSPARDVLAPARSRRA